MDRICGNCMHWHKHPADPNNLGQVRGDCRESPPACQMIGPQQTVVFYPALPPSWPGCSRMVLKAYVDPEELRLLSIDKAPR